MAGSPSPEQIERNASLVSDYKSGEFSIVDLVVKYRITSQRIYQILKRHDIKLPIDKSIDKI